MTEPVTTGQEAAGTPREASPLAAEHAQRLSMRDAAVFGVVAAGAFMVVLDFFIVLVALPSIAADLRATPSQLQLVVAGYAIANAAGLIAGGRCGDVWGRKRMFLAGMALFSVASACCAAADGGAQLVAFRIVQGAAGALLQPQVLALLSASFDGPKRMRLFGYYAVAMGLGGVAGQAVGGALIEAAPLGLTWQWCFLINLPIGLAAFVAGAVLLRETAAPAAEATDWQGLSIATLAIVLFVLPLTYGREALDTATNVGLVGSSLACGIAFFGLQSRRRRAGDAHLLRASLIDAPGFARGALTVLLFYCGLASFYFVLGLQLQMAVQLSPLASGAAFGLLGCAFMIASANAARLKARLGPRLVPVGSAVLLAGHGLQLAIAATGGPAVLMLGALLVEGAGIGMVMAPLVALTLAGVARHEGGLASGILGTMQSAGNALGVATVGSLYFAVNALPGDSSAGTGPGFVVALATLSALALLVGWQARLLGREADG